MPKKNILMSSGSTRTYVAPSDKFTYDTDTGYVSVDNISSSNFVLSGAANALVVSNQGITTTYAAVDYSSGNFLISDGTNFQVKVPDQSSIGPVEGDLTGSYPLPKVKSLSNVQSGSLPVSRGGLSGSGVNNILSAIPSGSIVIANSSNSLTVLTTSSLDLVNNTYILGSVSGSSRWDAITSSVGIQDANVQYFTCSVPTVSFTGSWIKANSNHQWARVLIQAGGGSGTAGITTLGGGGGGSGGFTDCILYVKNILSASVVVGNGGLGGTGSVGGVRNGVSSSFSGSNVFAAAYGGLGGATTTAGGNSGTGLTDDGVDGGTGTGANGAAGIDNAYCGSGGGGGLSAGSQGGKSGIYFLSSSGGLQNSPGTFKPNIFGYTVPVGFGSGGGGGAGSFDGGNGSYGAGGGGGGRNPTGATNGGNGGAGFVVIVSY